MKHYTLILISILLLLCGRVSAQYDDVSVYLEVEKGGCLETDKLYINLTSGYCGECKQQYNYNIELKVDDSREQRVVDTVFHITKQTFDRIVKRALSISSLELVEMRNKKSKFFFGEAVGIISKMTVDMYDYNVSYTMNNTEEKKGVKHLSNYLYVYKELERLTGGDFDNALLFGFQDIAIKK